MSTVERWSRERGRCPECSGSNLSHYRLGDSTVCEDCGREEYGMGRMRFIAEGGSR